MDQLRSVRARRALIDHAVPVVVENDANCAGWGEFVHGAGQGSSNMVALTVAPASAVPS